MSQKLLILGGGFGVYGYLPAAVASGWEVSTLIKYKEMMLERIELKSLVPDVNFIDESGIIPSHYDAIVIARTPDAQTEFVSINNDFRGHLFLEKPLGSTIAQHSQLLELLKLANCSFSIAYLFRYQDWYQKIIDLRNDFINCKVSWHIKKPPSNSWKSDKIQGGGLFAYYGIHFLAFLFDSEFGIEDISFFELDNGFRIIASDSVAYLEIELVNDQSNKFTVEAVSKSNKYFFEDESPFGDKPKPGTPDPRLPSLEAYLRENMVRRESELSLRLEKQILSGRSKFEAQMAYKPPLPL